VAIRTHGRRGRPGVPALREALADWLADGKALDSELERLMNRLVRRYRLPAVEFHPIICGYEVDFKIVGMPIVLECDSWEWHDKRRTKFENNRRQDIELTAAGFITVRFTWTMINRQPQWVAAMIRNAVRTWSALAE
jgi:very-short-patch-repair endonuclease